nr:ATPase, AAA-type, core [Tanacetum cinerariifolium]
MGFNDWQEVLRKKQRSKSKEDDVVKISTSIFVTNFPDSFTAKDLFHTCAAYGHVVDSYIPFKKSKTRKRFGFVRFINVFNVDRLVNNICTIWVGKLKIHANIIRFQRSLKTITNPVSANTRPKSKDLGVSSSSNLYVNVLKSHHSPIEVEPPTLVLDSDCLQVKDMGNSVMGRVKELASLTNIKTAFSNEGFVDFKIRYLGELRVWLEFASADVKKLFLDNVWVNSWFLVLKEGSLNFVPESRIVWIDVEGVPFKLWSNNTFKRISSKWGVVLDFDDQDDTYFHSKCICVLTKYPKTVSENFKIIFKGEIFWIHAKEALSLVLDFLDDVDEDESDDDSKGGGFSLDEGIFNDKVKTEDDDPSKEVPDSMLQPERQHNGSLSGESNGQKVNLSEDPFNIYPLLNKKNDRNVKNEVFKHTPNHPPGFTPNNSHINDIGSTDSFIHETPVEQERSSNDRSESVCSGHFKSSSVPRTGGSFLGLMEELIKVGNNIGYNMEGVLNNMTQIIETQGANNVYQ